MSSGERLNGSRAEACFFFSNSQTELTIDPCPSSQAGLQDDKEIELLDPGSLIALVKGLSLRPE